MPLSHVTKVFAVTDAKIAKVTADPAGGATVVAASVDVPGIKTVSIGGDVKTAELRGDNTRLDFGAVLSGVTIEFEYAKLSLDALAVLLGPTVVDSGTTPNQTALLGLTSANASLNYFQFTAQSKGTDTIGGDAVMTLYKCVLTGFPEGLGMAEEDYRTFKVSAAALPRLSDNKWLDVNLRETTAALP
jgi:hypothetical protein